MPEVDVMVVVPEVEVSMNVPDSVVVEVVVPLLEVVTKLVRAEVVVIVLVPEVEVVS